MRKLLTGIGALLVAACGPDLGDNETLRCDETLECGPASYCYRGFCVPDNIVPETVDVDPATSGVDAGQVLLSDDAGGPATEDASDASDSHDSAEPEDAAAVESDASSAQTPITPAPATPAPTPATPAPTPATPAMPAAPTAPAQPDAGVPAGSKCTLKECCAEAKKAQKERWEHEDDDEDWVPKPGKCGCSAPDLFNTLTCGLGSLTGLT